MTKLLLVGIASFASALIEDKYGRTSAYYNCTLSPDIGASGKYTNCTVMRCDSLGMGADADELFVEH